MLKSWAVARGPSRDSRDKRLAVQVEDHALDYGDFEGTIPPGSYGAGTVQLWDRGTWEPEGDRPPGDALIQGERASVLRGRRLKGSYVFVRMKRGGTARELVDWLLIKRRDRFARSGDADALLAEDRSIASGCSMAQIASGEKRRPNPFMAVSTGTARDV